jgi:hypothetical protein
MTTADGRNQRIGTADDNNGFKEATDQKSEDSLNPLLSSQEYGKS